MLDKQNEGKKAFLTGAFTLTAGLLLSKVFGAVYRIPLTNMLGVYGMGIYQLIFPLFALFMTLATAGIPTAISKSVAEKLALDDKRGALAVTKTALLFLGGLGTVAAVILFGLSEVLANIQKAPETVTAYRIISASIPLCSLSAGFKGYFNGTMNMKPASVMHITEQSVKLVVGLAAVASQLPDVIAGVYAAVFCDSYFRCDRIDTFGSMVFQEKRHSSQHPDKRRKKYNKTTYKLIRTVNSDRHDTSRSASGRQFPFSESYKGKRNGTIWTMVRTGTFAYIHAFNANNGNSCGDRPRDSEVNCRRRQKRC